MLLMEHGRLLLPIVLGIMENQSKVGTHTHIYIRPYKITYLILIPLLPKNRGGKRHVYSGPEGQSSGSSLIHVLSPQCQVSYMFSVLRVKSSQSSGSSLIHVLSPQGHVSTEGLSPQGDCDNLQVETSPPGLFICKGVASET